MPNVYNAVSGSFDFKGVNYVVRTRDPTTSDYKGFFVPTIWVNSTNDKAFILTDNNVSNVKWLQLSSGGSTASSITTDTANFDAWLSGTDNTAQKAFDTLEEVGKTITPQHSVLLAGSSYGITNTGVLTNGQLIIGNTSNAPSVSTLTAGSGITITNGSGTITIASSGGSGGGTTWEEVTSSTKSMSPDYAYGVNNGTGVTFTLPATASAGTVLEIIGISGIWKLAQNAGQTVYFGNTNTTTGVGGSLTATNRGDCIALRCTVADTDWRITSSVGNITVV